DGGGHVPGEDPRDVPPTALRPSRVRVHGEPPGLCPPVQVVKGGEGQVVHPVGPVEEPEPEDLVPSGDLYVASHVSSNLPVTRIFDPHLPDESRSTSGDQISPYPLPRKSPPLPAATGVRSPSEET